MDAKTFDAELSRIYDAADAAVTELVLRARRENADGEDGDHAVELDWEDRNADHFASLCGWIYDRMAGRNRTKRGSVETRLRKALGYNA